MSKTIWRYTPHFVFLCAVRFAPMLSRGTPTASGIIVAFAEVLGIWALGVATSEWFTRGRKARLAQGVPESNAAVASVTEVRFEHRPKLTKFDDSTMRLSQDIEPASWITARLHRLGQDVGSVIPEGFEAYARVFHPPSLRDSNGSEQPVRWQDIAAANGRSIEAEMQRLDIACKPTRYSPSGEELWNGQPRTGRVPLDIVTRLASTLALQTQTPASCWFAVWEGFGDLRIPENAAPKIANPARNLFLLHGAVSDVLHTLSEVEWIYLAPSIWWPNDRAWCVATAIDFPWTYVGGSASCIQAILADAVLEALPTKPEQGNLMEK